VSSYCRLFDEGGFGGEGSRSPDSRPCTEAHAPGEVANCLDDKAWHLGQETRRGISFTKAIVYVTH
jgi:hypothetical protein